MTNDSGAGLTCRHFSGNTTRLVPRRGGVMTRFVLHLPELGKIHCRCKWPRSVCEELLRRHFPNVTVTWP